MKYTSIKSKQQDKISELSDEVGLFWAFSNEQFMKNKTPLKKGDKYVSIGAGGYLPRTNFDKFIKGMKEIEKWARNAKKDAKEVILYELNNYECFYTGDITNALPILKDLGYSREEVKKIYLAERNKQTILNECGTPIN